VTGAAPAGHGPGTERAAIQTLPPRLNAERRLAGDARSRHVGAPAGSIPSSVWRPANRTRGASFDTVQPATTGGRCPRRSQSPDPVSRTSRRRSEWRRGSWLRFPSLRSSTLPRMSSGPTREGCRRSQSLGLRSQGWLREPRRGARPSVAASSPFSRPGTRTRSRPDRRGSSDIKGRRRPGVPPHVRSRPNAVSPSASLRVMASPARRLRDSMCRVTAAWDVARPALEATSPEFESFGSGAVPPPPSGRPSVAGTATNRSGRSLATSPASRGVRRPLAPPHRTAIGKCRSIRAQAARTPRRSAIRSNSAAPARMAGAPVPAPRCS